MSDLVPGPVIEPLVQITRYTVYAVPVDLCVNAAAWSLTVEWRGENAWAVCHISRCLADDGTWDWEPSPSNREDDWIEHHRFDETTALRLAREWAPKINVNGLTAADLIAKYATQDEM